MLVTLVLASTSWTMVIGGDIMLNGIRPSPKTFEAIKPFVQSASIATANLEIPLTDKRTATIRKTPAELKAKSQFILKGDPRHAAHIANAGFDLVGLANNHAMDYGFEGLKQEQSNLDKYGILYCGAGKNAQEAVRPNVVKAKDGYKVAFISFLAFKTAGGLWKCTPATLKTPGVAILNDLRSKTLKTLISAAKAQADFVVVWLHWGTERKTIPDPFQVKLGRSFVEAGADAVLGAHPHVLQGAESYAGRPIFYSLGNLVSPVGSSTALFGLQFQDKKLTGVSLLPCNIRSGRVIPKSKKEIPAAVSKFKQLCLSLQKAYPHKKSSPLPFSN